MAASERKKVRTASHAGSWYTDNGSALQKQLENFLEKAQLTDSSARAVISPHAGYSYSGQSAAYAYKNLDKNKVKRVFILGPAHHEYLSKCALSVMDEYATPLGNITLDRTTIDELYATGAFEWMQKSVDEEEHSIEMQLPYIYKMMQGETFALVPVLVGSLSKDAEAQYGTLFSKYFDDPANFFVISSDFCHWGKRFSFTYYEPNDGPIYKSIENLDRQGMDAIEAQDLDRWYTYLKKYKNTICGRHPIGILLQTLNYNKTKHKLKFVYYAQSNQCTSTSDSSVSYSVAVVVK